MRRFLAILVLAVPITMMACAKPTTDATPAMPPTAVRASSTLTAPAIMPAGSAVNAAEAARVYTLGWDIWNVAGVQAGDAKVLWAEYTRSTTADAAALRAAALKAAEAYKKAEQDVRAVTTSETELQTSIAKLADAAKLYWETWTMVADESAARDDQRIADIKKRFSDASYQGAMALSSIQNKTR